VTQTTKPDIESVNSIIKETFGRFHRGDYLILCGLMDGYLSVENKLGVIATEYTMMDPQYGGGIRGFLNSDGSKIVVIENYRQQGELYTKIYESRFGIPVEMKVVKNFHDLLPHLN
jgi:hypothetical protein